MTSSPLPPPNDRPDLTRLGNQDLLDLFLLANPLTRDDIAVDQDVETVCDIAKEALDRLARHDRSVLELQTPHGRSTIPIAAAAKFEAVFIPPNDVIRHATPGVVVTVAGPPAEPWTAKFVLQVLPDLVADDVVHRFAKATKDARVRTP